VELKGSIGMLEPRSGTNRNYDHLSTVHNVRLAVARVITEIETNVTECAETGLWAPLESRAFDARCSPQTRSAPSACPCVRRCLNSGVQPAPRLWRTGPHSDQLVMILTPVLITTRGSKYGTHGPADMRYIKLANAGDYVVYIFPKR
jgi:hypothetical protein